ncbi:DUF6461 domain-containing protein [Streptomyces minutiscleroticus]|uniref:DUF6461 domain-containing protein n=1 Tax=Streptomyces minutiscleroticus TaxID=68238 RepID=UPI00332CE0FA
MTKSALSGCVPSDHFGITCVRGLSPEEVLSRLSVTDQAPYPLCTPEEALQRFGWGFEQPAVRICRSEGWTLLLDVDDHGVLLQSPVLAHLSMGTEAVAVWKLLDGTTRIAHARSGELLAYYDAWHFQPPEGADPSFLDRALTDAGFFLDENWESDDWELPTAALGMLEREFGLTLSPEVARGPLPTVGLSHLRG